MAGLTLGLEHGRYFIYGQNGVHSETKRNTQNGHVDTQIEQANDKEVSQQLQAVSPDRNDQQAFDRPASRPNVITCATS